ncbi:MAG TPA: hypothetical protein VN782_11345 [Usitatibacter sp.]|nr:hypothetical protein [Usitatibacter sp.]
MYLEKTEITPAEQLSDREIAEATVAQLSDLDLSLIGGGMGDVQQ